MARHAGAQDLHIQRFFQFLMPRNFGARTKSSTSQKVTSTPTWWLCRWSTIWLTLWGALSVRICCKCTWNDKSDELECQEISENYHADASAGRRTLAQANRTRLKPPRHWFPATLENLQPLLSEPNGSLKISVVVPSLLLLLLLLHLLFAFKTIINHSNHHYTQGFIRPCP